MDTRAKARVTGRAHTVAGLCGRLGLGLTAARYLLCTYLGLCLCDAVGLGLKVNAPPVLELQLLQGALQRRTHALFLDRNQLSGPIPTELGQLGALADLSLDENQLTGQEAFGAYMEEHHPGCELDLE